MRLNKLNSGNNIPHDINVIIEISAQSSAIKYEIDKETELLFVDRFVDNSMCYPCNYGFIPHTLSEDGDPLDALVITPFPLQPTTVITCRPIGMLLMTDESGPDAKILAVPTEKLTPLYNKVQQPEDLGDSLLQKIAHFFQHYKDLEKDKWVKINGWSHGEAAKKEIQLSIDRYTKQVKR